MATVTCTCGKASFVFAASRPRDAIECCCCDCTAGLKWCEGQGGPKVPNPPQTDIYMDNDIVEVRGEEHLRAMKLRKDSGSVRIICGGCKTQLVSVHFLYFRQRVMVVPAACRFEYGDDGGPIEPYVRIHTKFYDEEKYGPLPPFEHGDSYASDSPSWLWKSELLARLARPPVGERKGEPVQEILKRLGDPIIAGIDEPDLEGHFKTGMGMFSLTFRSPFASAPEKATSNADEGEDDANKSTED